MPGLVPWRVPGSTPTMNAEAVEEFVVGTGKGEIHSGSSGPAAADELLARDGHAWRPLD